MMATNETITLYDSERELLVEVNVSTEDARRAEKDIFLATELLKTALKQQSEDVPQDAEFEEEQGCEDSEAPLYRWSPPCFLLLLETFRKMENNFNSGKLSHKKLWSQISAELIVKGYNVTGTQCASKLRSLKKTYKATKDHNNKYGNDRRNWQFFEIMDDIFSGKAWSKPVAIASSTGLSIQNKNSKSVEEGSDCGCSTIVGPSKSKQSIASLLGKRLKQKKEHEQNKAKRHKERMEMDIKWLEVIQNMQSK